MNKFIQHRLTFSSSRKRACWQYAVQMSNVLVIFIDWVSHGWKNTSQIYTQDEDKVNIHTQQFSSSQGPDFRKILRRTYEKLIKKAWLMKNLGWACDFQKKSHEKLRTKLCKTYDETYDDITGILWKRKIRGQWWHSGNPLSEAVIGRIPWAKNNWRPEWRFPKNAFEKWLIIFLRKF